MTRRLAGPLWSSWNFEPWPDEVSGSEVLSSLATVIEQFLYIKPEQADATALWCLMTWLHNHPELEVTSKNSPFSGVVDLESG